MIVGQWLTFHHARTKLKQSERDFMNHCFVHGRKTSLCGRVYGSNSYGSRFDWARKCEKCTAVLKKIKDRGKK